MDKLPHGWVKINIDDVAEVNPRKSVDLSLDELVTFVPMAAVSESSGTIASPTKRRLREVNKGFTQFLENDVIVAKITPSMENGKAAVATDLANGVGFGSTEFHVFRSRGAVLPKFLWYFVRQQSFRDNARKVMTGAVGQQRVPADYLKSHPLLLPPLQEQERIVDKVGNLIARTARARSELEKVPALLAMYKSAVLELAFSGKLTADLRGDDEDGASGLPTGWAMHRLGEISEIQSGIQVGKRRSGREELVEVPYLRVANVQRGWLNLGEIKTIFVTPEEKIRLLLVQGDVLMNEGGDRDKLGRGWVWSGQIDECIHQNHVFRIRMNAGTLPPEFVSHFANERGQQYFFDEGTQTTNLASISKRKVSALPLPVPPFEEAVEIVRRIERAFVWLDRAIANHSGAFQLLNKLDTALLAKAFDGELTSRDVHDESASALVERVNAEWVTQPRKIQDRKQKYPEQKQEELMGAGKKLEQVLTEAKDWLSAQAAFQRCGIGDGASTEEIERIYSELRDLDRAGKLEAEAVNDEHGRKIYDRIRLKVV
jgi:type I restriction enzyme S subunit